MLKIYKDKDGYTFQYEEGTQPDGAVEVKQTKTANKQAKPTNKARTARTKKVVD